MNRWERNARNRNRARDRKLPLLAHAGVADQVVPDWTPDAVEERVTRIVEGFTANMAAMQERRVRSCEAYWFLLRLHCPDIDPEDVADEIERKPYLQRLEYQANHLNNLIARHTGRTPVDVFEECQRMLDGETEPKPPVLSRKAAREQRLLETWK